MSSNIKDISNFIKGQLPHYLSSDEDYGNFVRFLELYYQWLSLDGNVSDVTSNIVDYSDLDKTVDVFVDLYKNELAQVWPNIIRIKGGRQTDIEFTQQENSEINSQSSTETALDQEFYADGVTPKFKLNYFDPIYYLGDPNADTIVLNIRVFKNVAGSDRGSDLSLDSVVEYLVDPAIDPNGSLGSYVELTENTDYTLQDNTITFIDSNGDPSAPPNDDLIKVRFLLRSNLAPTSTPDSEDAVKASIRDNQVEKTSYKNKKNFYKFMKDFYQSKGTEKSYDFLFRAIFNESIEVYYPKQFTFKTSNNVWSAERSLRTVPYSPVNRVDTKLSTPYKIEGLNSKASAIIESKVDKKIGNYDVREYFITQISGTFTSKEKVKISQTDNTSYEETLYECIVGFDIVNPGKNNPRNVTLNRYISNAGSGTGFSANITHTSSGPVEQIDIVGSGNNYITGEEIDFPSSGSLGSGAKGFIKDIGSVTTSNEVIFNQNPQSNEYPQNVFDISLSGGSFFSNSQEEVSIENIDFKFSDVLALYDYESSLAVSGNSAISYLNDDVYFGFYVDKTNNTIAYRQNASLEDVENPSPRVVNLNENETTETRIRRDLEMEVSSVNSDGGITGISISNTTADPSSIFPNSVNLQGQVAHVEGSEGFGAAFDISFDSSVGYQAGDITLSSSDNSQMYFPNDLIFISGTKLSPYGLSPTHDITIKVDTVSGGVIRQNIGPNNPTYRYTTNSNIGTGAYWDIDTTAATYPRLISVLLSDQDNNGQTSPTSGYVVGDEFLIKGSDLGGTDGEHDLVIVVTLVDNNGRIESYNTNGRAQTGQISTFSVVGTPVYPDSYKEYSNPSYTLTNTPGGVSGVGLRLNVLRTGTGYVVRNPSAVDKGTGYVVGTEITFDGSVLGGVSTTNDLVIRVDRVNSSGGIESLSTVSGTASNTSSYLNVSTRVITGSDATFNIDITGGNFSVTVANIGKNYEVGQKLTIPGSRLAEQWIKDGFKAGLSKTGEKALFTDLGYTRTNNIEKLLTDNLTNNELTIDFWYFRKSTSITDNSSPGSAIFSFNEETGGTQKTVLWQKTDGTLQLDDTSGNSLTTPQLEFGVWHHIAIHFSNSSSTIYVDGIKRDTYAGNMLDIPSNPTILYVGARQLPGASYVVGDYTLGFFGSFRLTKGQRYEEQTPVNSVISIEDTGTDNSLSGNGLNPIYVNPVPSKEIIRKSIPFTETITATAGQTTISLDYDENQVVEVLVNSVPGVGVTATDGTTIILANPLTAGDTVIINYYAALADNIEYVIYDQAHSSQANKIFLRKRDQFGIYSTYTLPDGFSLRVKFTTKPPASITATELVSGGDGYIKFPYGNVSTQTNSYTSVGEGAFFTGKGSNIGGISKISIYNHPIHTDQEGFGVGYDTAPTLDLSSLGDGTSQVTVLTGPLCEREGAYVNNQGFLSDDNRITDSYLWQDYSYVIKVGRFVDEWRKIVKKVVHPAGMMMFGEYSVTTTARRRKTVFSTWSQLLFEIIKNVNMKVKNMDGLGVWTLPAGVDTFNTNDFNSHGIRITYDNRQKTVNSSVDGIYNGVGTGEISDDTVGAATVDTGSGRYALLTDNLEDAPNWLSVTSIAMNYKDAYGKNFGYYYSSEIIGNTISVWNTSDAIITDNEHLNVRPFAKYKIKTVENYPTSADEYVVFGVELISSYDELPTLSPNDKVEFRWDNIFRGNVDRNANYWIGSIMDGANPRDEKMIINISGRFNNNKEGDVPTLHTTWKSLERFKFYFTAFYPYDRLAPVLFSPVGEIYNSPYWKHRQLIEGNGLTHVTAKAGDANIWYMLPVEENGDNEWIANTDGTDHKWTNTRITEITEKSDRKYKAVLDSFINITPVYLILCDEEPDSNTRRRCGPTNLSVERSKFNEKLQSSLDYNLDPGEDLIDKQTFLKYTTGMHGRTNYASESSIYTRTLADTTPITTAELNNILETVMED